MQPRTTVKPTLYRHPHGITAVDCEYLYSGHAAAHLIVDEGRAAFVDVGTNDSVPYLLGALDELGIARAAVDYLLLTHVHLDHAGGAGALMQELPNARALLHPRGAPHMIDPTRLVAGAKAVYGEESFRRMYGELLPIPSSRVRVVADGDRVALGSRSLELIHTPGHAQHHYWSSMRRTPASSAATPSASPIVPSTPARAPSSPRPRYRRSSTPSSTLHPSIACSPTTPSPST